MKNNLKPQSKIKRFFKGIFKTIGFAALYLFVAIGTAAGIIFLSPSGSAPDDTFEIPVQLTKIMNNFQLVKALDVDLQLDIETASQSFNVELDGEFDFHQGFDGLGADGLFTFNTDNEAINVNFTYESGQMFVDVLGGKFLLQTNGVFDGISEIATMLELEMPDLGVMGLDNLDANTILSFLSDLEEEKGSNSITLNINVPIIGKIQIICDMNYSVKSVTLPKFDLSGTSIALSSELNYPNQIEINTPQEQDYLDATGFLDIASIAIKSLKQNAVGLDAHISAGDLSLDGTINADLENLSASFETNVLDVPLKITSINKNIYLDYGNAYLKFSLGDAKKLQNFLQDQFGLDLPIEKIAKIVSQMQDGNILGAVRDYFDGGESNLSAVDLSKIQAIEKLDSGFKLTVRDFGSVNLNISDGNLASIEISSDKFDANLKTVEAQPVTVTSKKYADVGLAIPAAKALIDTLQNDRLAGSGTLTLDGQNYDINFGYDHVRKCALLDTQLFGNKLQIAYMDNTIFAEFKDLKIYADQNELDYLLSIFNFEQQNSDLAQNLAKLLTSSSFSQFVGIEQTQNGLRIQLLDNIFVSLAYKDNLESVEIESENLKFKARITPSATLVMPNLNVKNYQPARLVAEKIEAIYKLVDSNKVYLNVSGTYGDTKLDGNVNYDSAGLQALLTLTYQNLSAKLGIFDEKIWLDFKDLHLCASLDQIDEISALLKDKFGFDLQKLLSDTSNKQSINDLLASLSFAVDDQGLTLASDSVHASIIFANGRVSRADISSGELQLRLNNLTNKTGLASPNASLYTPVSTLLERAAALYDYVSAQEFYLSLEANVEAEPIANSLALSGHLNYDKSGLSLQATTTVDGLKMQVKLIDGVVYLDIFDLLAGNNSAIAKFNLSDIESTLSFVRDEFGIDFLSTYLKLTEALKSSTGSLADLDVPGMLSKLSLSYQQTSDTLKVVYDGYTISISFKNKKVAALTIKSDGLTFTAQPQTKKTISVNQQNYFDLNKVKPFISKINSYLQGKKFKLVADADFYQGSQKIYSTKDMSLYIDASSKLQFYAGAKLSSSVGQDINLTTALYRDKFYFDYNGLKLSLSENGLKELLSMACRALNIDQKLLNNLFDVAQTSSSDFDVSIFTKLLPSTSADPLALLKYLKGIEIDKFDSNVLIINLDGSALSSDQRSSDMQIRITTDSTSLKRIDVENLYVGSADDAHFNLKISVDKFTSLKTPDLTQSYIDLSGAEDLVKAIANTAAYSTFSISGVFSIDLKPGIIHIKRDIPVNIKFSLSNLAIQNLMIEIGPVPVIDVAVYNVNNDTNWTLPTINNRMFYVYYQNNDDYVYFYRTENRKRGDSFQKATKAHVETVLSDALYYLQWGTGLNDEIMDLIRQTIEHDIDLGNVVTSFSAPSSSSGFYNTTLNMHEITGFDKMGSLVIGLALSRLSGKNVVSKATFDLDMPLISGTTLYLKSDNLSITPGAYFNTSAIRSFISKFNSKNGKELVEYSAYNDSWTSTNDRTFTVNFDANAGIFTDMNYSSVSGTFGTKFTPPTLSYRSVGQKISGTDYTIYQFDGWYTSPNFEPETKVTTFTIPHKNVTLHAKWKVNYAYRTVKFYSERISGQSSRLLGTQYARVDTALRSDYSALGISQFREQTYTGYVDGVYGRYRLMQQLVWVDALGRTLTSVPNESLSVWASYQTYQAILIS